jgi:5-methylthioadenosine/S-adenosylhomocysteine deaminase
VIAPGIFSFATGQSDHSFQDAADYLERFYSQPKEVLETTRVIPCVGPHDIYSTTPELLEDCVALAEKYDAMIHMHISETQRDNDESMERYGKTPTEVAEGAGIFKRRALFAHCIFLTDTDMDIFHKYDASVSFNPVTNLKLCEGILPIPKLKEKGVNVTIGVDGAQSNNSLNLLSDTKTGIIMEKLAANNPCSLTAMEAIRMITINGAKAIGMEDQIGSLEIGKKADLISIDVNTPAMTPILRKTAENLSSHVIYTDTQINDVMVDGEFLLRDKKCCRVNPEEIMEKAQEAANYIIQQVDKK